MRPQSTGVVYFIRSGLKGLIKIGYSSGDPVNRLSSMQTGNPATLYLLGCHAGTLRTEARLHREFSPVRVRREWFAPSDELMAHIRAYAVEYASVGEIPLAFREPSQELTARAEVSPEDPVAAAKREDEFIARLAKQLGGDEKSLRWYFDRGKTMYRTSIP